MISTVFGISNCDTIRKARAWLQRQQIDYEFHDYKVRGVDPTRLARWCTVLGWELLLNRSGTTFRNLPPIERADLDRQRAIALMQAHPSLIKRPVLERGSLLLVGFDPPRYEVAFKDRMAPRP